MAPLPNIAGVWRVALNWKGPGALRAVNVWHFRRAAASASEVFDALSTALTREMFDPVSSACSVEHVDITPLFNQGATQSFAGASRAPKWQGANDGDPVPAACGLVLLHTAKRGAANRGRVFLPFVPESIMSAGKLSDAVVLETTTGWSQFLTTTSTGGLPMVVASYKHGTAEDVTTVTVEAPLATQKRRQNLLR